MGTGDVLLWKKITIILKWWISLRNQNLIGHLLKIRETDKNDYVNILYSKNIINKKCI